MFLKSFFDLIIFFSKFNVSIIKSENIFIVEKIHKKILFFEKI